MLQVHHLPLPELIFELSIGEVVIILIVTALILLVITIERTQKTTTKTKPAYTLSPMMAMKECPARFGFLQKLSKGSTIPQECYICPLLIECLGFKRTPRTQS